MNKFKSIYILISFSLIFASCSKDNSTNPTMAGIFKGIQAALGNGTAVPWVELDEQGNPVSVGITLSESALTGLDTIPFELNLMMPSKASATNIVHIGLDWNPFGHEPDGVYDKPHFDFHFYMVDTNFRNQITMMGDDTIKVYKMPVADYFPPDYMFVPGGGVPRMGEHSVDVTSPELHGQLFTTTMIYGYYDGNMIFYEPMITSAYLASQPNFTADMKVPAKYPKPGYYPTKYSIMYDSAKKEITIKIFGMQKFNG
ncbi:MAG: hypothetical protein EPN82_16460 [Bacteroidetes bacterium]|nr:MAG: hypothetical protein EPN82_16460 [Bacteroidota bacterium]